MAKKNTKKSGEKFDVKTMIADRIIEQLEEGVVPWQKPWIGGINGAWKRHSGQPYSLLNQMLLPEATEYVTMNQCNKEGGKVNKGATPYIVTFWKMYEKEVETENENGEAEKINKKFFTLRYYRVFRVEDTTLERKRNKALSFDGEPIELCEACKDNYIKTSGVKFKTDKGGDKAFFMPSTDSVTVPALEQFKYVEEYYSTVFHELAHSTGHESRLNRISKTAAFGNEEYSKEELVAELTAAAVLHSLGVETKKSFKNSTAYIESWLQALKNDKNMIISAASRSDKAMALIMDGFEGLKPSKAARKPPLRRTKRSL